MLLILFASLAASPAELAFVDPRDGQSYRVVAIEGQRWMGENLRFASPGSRCQADAAANCAAFGRHYRFDEALRSCPPGWRLPSDEDWMRLEVAVGVPPEELANERARGPGSGDRLKAGGSSGFEGLLAGYHDPHDKQWQRLGEAGAFWAATEAGSDDVSGLAWHRDLNLKRNGIYRSKVNVTYLLSVRCLES